LIGIVSGRPLSLKIRGRYCKTATSVKKGTSRTQSAATATPPKRRTFSCLSMRRELRKWLTSACLPCAQRGEMYAQTVRTGMHMRSEPISMLSEPNFAPWHTGQFLVTGSIFSFSIHGLSSFPRRWPRACFCVACRKHVCVVNTCVERPFGASQVCRKHACIVNTCVSYTRAWHGHLAQFKCQDLDASISDEADLVGIESLPSHLVEFSKERTWTGPAGMVQTSITKRLYINAPHSLVVTAAHWLETSQPKLHAIEMQPVQGLAGSDMRACSKRAQDRAREGFGRSGGRPS
jgi:hypothetical protein